jgi:hypothetical protein
MSMSMRAQPTSGEEQVVSAARQQFGFQRRRRAGTTQHFIYCICLKDK